MAVTYTQADIDALKAAIVSGARRVRIGNREVEYQSLRDMQAVLATMEQQVAAASGTPSYIRIATSKGF